MKSCKKCGTEKSLSEFHNCANKKDGKLSWCKVCQNKSSAENRARNPDRRKKYYTENSEKYRKAARDYYWANREDVLSKKASDRKQNVEKYKERDSIRRSENRDLHIELCRKWRAANPEKQKAASKAWRDRNPESRRASKQNRRARERSAKGRITKLDVIALMHLQRGKCANCHTPLADGYHVDHVMPLAKGGSNERHNLQLLCPFCNLSKNALDPLDWAAKNGRLL